MNCVLFDDYILSKIFEKLKSKELVIHASLVCKKWLKVAFTENHRPCPVGVYTLLHKNMIPGQYKTYPLLGFRALYELNLLKEIEPNRQLNNSTIANPFDGQKWVVTKNKGTVLEPKSVSVQARIGDNTTFCEFSAYSTGVYEMTQVIDLEQRFTELGLTPEASVGIRELCPDLRLSFMALQFLKNSDSGVLIKITASMDNGNPVLAPYNNNTYTSYTRDALFVKSAESDSNKMYTVRRLDLTLSEYPRQAKRLIVSIRGHFENAHLVYCKPTLQLANAGDQSTTARH
eukprot:g6057.t1